MQIVIFERNLDDTWHMANSIFYKIRPTTSLLRQFVRFQCALVVADERVIKTELAECTKRFVLLSRHIGNRQEYNFFNISSLLTDKPDEEFWEAEWLKHGTCSAVLLELDTSNKYLSKALDWLEEYNMTTILAASNIVPDNDKTYKLFDIHTAITRVLNKNPSITCYIDRTTSEQYLSEIRICFDQQLNLVDCDGINSNSKQSAFGKDNVITNCVQKEINYRVDLLEPTSGLSAFVVVFVLLILLAFVFVCVKRKPNSTMDLKHLGYRILTDRYQHKMLYRITSKMNHYQFKILDVYHFCQRLEIENLSKKSQM